jgi:uncharacterized protein YdaU (DUF1376 family)
MSKKNDIWMPLYIGDYLAATPHLSAEESGAYLHLLMHQWKNGSLPADSEALRRIARVEKDAWSNAWAMLEPFFDIANSMPTQMNLERIREEWNTKKASASGKARAAAGKRWEKDAPSMAQAMPQPCPSSSPSSSSSQEPNPVPPEAIAKAVQVEAAIFGIKPLVILTDVCRRELDIGIPPDKVREALVSAWQRFKAAAPHLEYLWGAEKFFGEGHWKDESAWPWKEGTLGSDKKNQTGRVSPATQRGRESRDAIRAAAARRYGVDAVEADGGSAGVHAEPDAARGNAGHVPDGVGRDRATGRPKDVSGRVVEGAT